MANQRSLIVEELDRRRRPLRVALLIDPPHYLVAELGPVPEALLARRRWRAAAERVEQVRQRIGYRDQRRAFPPEIRDLSIRREVERLRSQLAGDRDIERARSARPFGIER